jgi:MYXO-CTERM domain-containing protein
LDLGVPDAAPPPPPDADFDAAVMDAAQARPQIDGGDQGCMATSDAGFGGLLGLMVLLGLRRRRRR